MIAAKALVAAWLMTFPTPSSTADTHTGPQDTGDRVELSLDDARDLGRRALNQRQPRLAFAISDGLLRANPDDGHALYIRAFALGQMQDFSLGRRAAARAYRVADTDLKRFEAARLAADLSFADERFTHSQVWLRRAAHYAPDDATRDRTVLAFRKARDKNPAALQLRFSIDPSNNVNNGASSPFNVIEGSPIVGLLSPSALAIKGLVATADIHGSYRLRETDRSQTRLTGRAYLRHVEFSNPVPGISADDLATQRLQLGLSHIWAPGQGGFWRAELSGGRTWYGDDPLHDFTSAGLHRSQKLTDNLRLTLGATVEEQFDKRPPIRDATVWTGTAGLRYALAGGGKVGAHLQYRQIDSQGANRASTQWTGVISYDHGRQIGPASISAAVGRSVLDFERYFVIFAVPGGRTDRSWFGTLTASFDDYSYMGFVPTVTVRAEKSQSNISRFDVEQTGVSFGIRSEF